MDVDGARPRAARHRRMLTLRELGQRAGVGFNTICLIENGLQRPRPTTLRKLAATLGVAPEALLAANAGEPDLEGGKRVARTNPARASPDARPPSL